jgi:hypothetical protein
MLIRSRRGKAVTLARAPSPHDSGGRASPFGECPCSSVHSDRDHQKDLHSMIPPQATMRASFHAGCPGQHRCRATR